ncbi:caspase family protein [Chelatococcus sp. CO-6]|uniref:caspase family protein n=2 Tax=unclassified Chelatococcus TaxID=2638111 RepID=UPI00069ED3A2|nr:caspase family protein [Chelatococcus sp. CO-6]
MLRRTLFLIIMASALIMGAGTSFAQQERFALVIGQADYPSGSLPTTLNDAGLVAQTLRTAGFDVSGGADLGGDDLRHAVREFLGKVQGAGRDATVVVYLAGQALQIEGENYFLPIDARLDNDSDVPLEGFRISDMLRSLAGTPVGINIVILDAARDYPKLGGQPIAPGLAIMDAPQGFAIAFSAAPNTVAPEEQGPYGPYATALAEMMQQPGLPLEVLFDRVRLRVHEATAGRQTPWDSLNLGGADFFFFEPEPGSAPVAGPPPRRSIEQLPAPEAYVYAIEEDTIPVYQEFLRVYPQDPMARRVRVILAERREALIWRRTLVMDSPEAYWTYLRRYPRGPHAEDSRRRLSRLSVALEPPRQFDIIEYDDLPPRLPDEFEDYAEIYEIRDLPPPPPPPVAILPPRPAEFERLPPPPPPPTAGFLPIPTDLPVPSAARRRPEGVFRPALDPQRVIDVQAPQTAPSPAAPEGARPGTDQPPPPTAPAPQRTAPQGDRAPQPADDARPGSPAPAQPGEAPRQRRAPGEPPVPDRDAAPPASAPGRLRDQERAPADQVRPRRERTPRPADREAPRQRRAPGELPVPGEGAAPSAPAPAPGRLRDRRTAPSDEVRPQRRTRPAEREAPRQRRTPGEPSTPRRDAAPPERPPAARLPGRQTAPDEVRPRQPARQAPADARPRREPRPPAAAPPPARMQQPSVREAPPRSERPRPARPERPSGFEGGAPAMPGARPGRAEQPRAPAAMPRPERPAPEQPRMQAPRQQPSGPPAERGPRGPGRRGCPEGADCPQP